MRDLRLYAVILHSKRQREVFIRFPAKLAMERAMRRWKPAGLTIALAKLRASGAKNSAREY